MKSIFILFLLGLTSCTSIGVCEKPKIPLPIAPVLPYVTGEEVSCLSKETYAKLVKRELKLREYSEKCVTILKEVTVHD